MTDVRDPPAAGIVASALVLVIVALPYVLLSGDEAAGLGTYYSAGLGGPWAVALVALLSIVAFAAGREERSDPVVVSGAVLVFGVFATVLSLVWAVLAADVGAQIGTVEWLTYHRWALVGASLLIVASAAWYVRALEIL